YIFFFQSEDGIRDWSVTGVQTCALPISQGRDRRRRQGRGVRLRQHGAPASAGQSRQERTRGAVRTQPALRAGKARPRRRAGDPRSEERRVGKEMGQWWSQGA